MGTKAMGFLNDLATAAHSAGVPTDKFSENALRQPSVALCRGNAVVYRAGSGASIRGNGASFMPGLLHPTAEVV